MTDIVSIKPRKPCLHCGQDLPRQDGGRKYCSVACDKAAIRARGPTRFWAKVDKAGPGGCWLYTGFKKWDGYGWVARSSGNSNTRWMTAHRYSWILTHGEPAEGLSIMHLCDVPACCNPAHLQLGTHQENMLDAKVKRRHAFGERSRGAKLTFAKVVELKKLRDSEGWTFTVLAERYGVSVSAAQFAYSGRTWKIRQAAVPIKMHRQPRPKRLP